LIRIFQNGHEGSIWFVPAVVQDTVENSPELPLLEV
jgi:hypothetical protein